MTKKDITSGEVLCTFLKHNIVDCSLWPELALMLDSTGRGAEWRDFFEEVVSTQLTGRLVVAGKAIAENLGGRSALGELVFKQQINTLIADTKLELPKRTLKSKLSDLIERAVRATYGEASNADKCILREDAGRKPRCYLCNQQLVLNLDSIFEPTDEDKKRAVEYEHVWPRAFGGDTVIDNLALSCNDCNKRKASYANWAMVDIQSLILSHNPSTSSLEKISGLRRFAMLSYEAHRLARENSLSLKAAHLLLQNAIAVPRVRRLADVADFFNLIGHVENN